MCTMIGTRVRVSGAARSGAEWAAVESASVTLDHATRAWSEHALRVDLADADGAVRAAFELDIGSARALLGSIRDAVAAADRAGIAA